MLLRVQSNFTEALASYLVAQVELAKGDVFSREILVVQRPGMDRWLTQFAAGHQGLAWDFQSVPLRKLWSEVARASPWGSEALAWVAPSRMRFAILDQLLALPPGEIWDPIRAHSQKLSSAMEFAQQQAALYESYLEHRSEQVQQWEQDPPGDDWQGALWHRLVGARAEAQDVAMHRASPNALRLELLSWLSTEDPEIALRLSRALGPRIHFFGYGEIPAASMCLMQALSRHLEVTDYRIFPTQRYLGETQEEHRLLHGWSAGYRKLAMRLEELQVPDAKKESIFVDYPELSQHEGRAVSDLDRLCSSFERSDAQDLLFQGDGSIQIHACWGMLREVEVLHDRIAAALSEHPDWSYEDVVVWVSDLSSYAPWIEAVFASVHPSPGPVIPYRIVDSHQGPQSPVSVALFALLESFGERSTRERLLDLLGLETTKTAFGWDDEMLGEIALGIDEAQIRWGQNAKARARRGQPAEAANSWEEGLERWVLGRAYEPAMWADAGSRLVEPGVLPLQGPHRVDDESLGQFARFLGLYFKAREVARQDASVSIWARRCRDWLSQFVPASADPPGLEHLLKSLATLEEDQLRSGAQEQCFDRATWVCMLESVVHSRKHAALWGRGGVTFAQLQSGRPVPANMVALLGMGQGQFPRAIRDASWGLRTQTPVDHELSSRDEDRMALVESLLGAKTRWICTYSSRDPQGEHHWSPSPLIEELQAFWEAHLAEDAAKLTVQHPLTDFIPSAWSTQDPRVRGHRKLAWEIAGAILEASSEPSKGHGPIDKIGAPLEADKEACVELRLLLRYFSRPTAQLMQRRLGVRVEEEGERWTGLEPGVLDGLTRYQLSSDLVSQTMAGADPEEFYPHLAAQGRLPWGQGGRAALRAVQQGLDPLWQEIGRAFPDLLRDAQTKIFRGGVQLAPQRIEGEVEVTLARGAQGEDRVLITPGGISAKRKLRAWIEHLFCAALEQPSFAGTLLLGLKRVGKTSTLLRAKLAPVDPARARHELEQLLQIYRLGQRWPLPLFHEAGHDYAKSRHQDKKDHRIALVRARKSFESSYGPREREAVQDWPTAHLFDDPQALTDVRAKQALAQLWPEAWRDSPSDFAAVSMAIWEPYFLHLDC